MFRRRNKPQGFIDQKHFTALGLGEFESADIEASRRSQQELERSLSRGDVSQVEKKSRVKFAAIRKKALVAMFAGCMAVVNMGAKAGATLEKMRGNTRKPVPEAVDAKDKKFVQNKVEASKSDEVQKDSGWKYGLKFDNNGWWSVVMPQYGWDARRTTVHTKKIYIPQAWAPDFGMKGPQAGQVLEKEVVDRQIMELEAEITRKVLPQIETWEVPWMFPGSEQAYLEDPDNMPLTPMRKRITALKFIGVASDEGASPSSMGREDKENKHLSTVRGFLMGVGIPKEDIEMFGPDYLSKLVANNAETRKELTDEDIKEGARRSGKPVEEVKRILGHIQIGAYESLSNKGDMQSYNNFADLLKVPVAGSEEDRAWKAVYEYNRILAGGEVDKRLSDPNFKRAYEDVKKRIEERGVWLEVQYEEDGFEATRHRVPGGLLWLLPLAFLRRRRKDGPVDQPIKEPTPTKTHVGKGQEFNPPYADNDQRWYDLEPKSGIKVPPPPAFSPYPENRIKQDKIGDVLEGRMNNIGGLYREVQINPEDPEHTKNLWLVWTEDLWRYFEDPKVKELGADYLQMMHPVIDYMRENGWDKADESKRKEIATKLELYLSVEIINAWKEVDLNRRKEYLEKLDEKKALNDILSGLEKQGNNEEDLALAELFASELFQEYQGVVERRIGVVDKRNKDKVFGDKDWSYLPASSKIAANKFQAWQKASEKARSIRDELTPKKEISRTEGVVDYDGLLKQADYFSAETDEQLESAGRFAHLAEFVMDEWDRVDNIPSEQKALRREKPEHKQTAIRFAKALVKIRRLAKHRAESSDGTTSVVLGNKHATKILRDRIPNLEEPILEKDGFNRENIGQGLDYENNPRQVLFAKYHAQALVTVAGNLSILPKKEDKNRRGNAMVIMEYWQAEALKVWEKEKAITSGNYAPIVKEGKVEVVSEKPDSQVMRSLYAELTKNDGFPYENIAMQLREELPRIISEKTTSQRSAEAAKLERATELVLNQWDGSDFNKLLSEGIGEDEARVRLASRRENSEHLEVARNYASVILKVVESLPIDTNKEQIVEQLRKVMENSGDFESKQILTRELQDSIQAS